MWLLMFIMSQCEAFLIAFHAVASIQFWVCSMIGNVICVMIFVLYAPQTTTKSYDDILSSLK